MEKIKKLSKKGVSYYKKLAENKHYIEFFAAVLTVPVLITVIILNINSLKSIGKPVPSPTPEVKEEKIYITAPVKNSSSNNVKTAGGPTSSVSSGPTRGQCKPEIGPISIDSPAEGERVSDNPVEVNVNYEAGEFCAVVWSYRINNSQWSGYDDKSIALYNMSQGDIKLELKVKSIVSAKEKMLTRNFIYTGNTQISTPTPNLESSNNSTASAN